MASSSRGSRDTTVVAEDAWPTNPVSRSGPKSELDLAVFRLKRATFFKGLPSEADRGVDIFDKPRRKRPTPPDVGLSAEEGPAKMSDVRPKEEDASRRSGSEEERLEAAMSFTVDHTLLLQ
jgi:hypothetical protein